MHFPKIYILLSVTVRSIHDNLQLGCAFPAVSDQPTACSRNCSMGFKGLTVAPPWDGVTAWGVMWYISGPSAVRCKGLKLAGRCGAGLGS